jgi:hypothetical protein
VGKHGDRWQQPHHRDMSLTFILSLNIGRVFSLLSLLHKERYACIITFDCLLMYPYAATHLITFKLIGRFYETLPSNGCMSQYFVKHTLVYVYITKVSVSAGFIKIMLVSKVKLSRNRPWRPIDCKMLRIPHCLDNRLIDSGKVVSPTHQPHFTPQKH